MQLNDVLTVELVESIYREHINAGVLRDRLALESALGVPFSTWEGKELYPTLTLKAARLLYHVQSAQAYSDGNKRIAWLALVVFLGLHELTIADTSEDEAAEFVLKVAERQCSVEEAARWIGRRI